MRFLLLLWLLLSVHLVNATGSSPVQSYPVAPIQSEHIIPILDNRFRIDHHIDEVTFFIRREPGSASAILVKPNGEKWFLSDHPDYVHWSSSPIGEIIRIERPPIGPWQILGELLPQSAIYVNSDIQIMVEPFPEKIYYGQQFVRKARLLADGEKVQIPGLDYLIKWSVELISKQNIEQNNFGFPITTISTYQDSGVDYDELPFDGTFTANATLSYPEGSYQIKVHAKNNSFVRSYSQTVDIIPSPVQIEPIFSNSKQLLQISYRIDDNIFNLDKSQLRWKMTTPDGRALQGTEMILSGNAIYPPQLVEAGSYQFEGTFFGVTQDDRPVILTLKPIRFEQAPPKAIKSVQAYEQQFIAEQAEMNEQSLAYLLGVLFDILIVLLFLSGCAIAIYLMRKWHLTHVQKLTSEAALPNNVVELKKRG